MTSLVLHSSTKAVTSLYKATKSVRHDLPLVKGKFANFLVILKQSCQIVSDILSLWKLDIVIERVIEELERNLELSWIF